MTDKPKTIYDALAEVQRKVNEERARRVEEMNIEIQEKNIEEGLGDLVKGGVQLAKNFGLGLRGMNVKGAPVPGRGAITSKATDTERAFNAAGKTARDAAPKVGAGAAVGTGVGAMTAKTGSASSPKQPEAPKAAPAPTSTGPKASDKPSTTKGGYFKSAPSVSKGDYTVKGGETLSGIAKKHGTSVGAIQSMNKGLTDPSKIAKGAKLNLPSSVKEDIESINEENPVASVVKSAAKSAPTIAKKATSVIDDIKGVIANKMSAPKANLGREATLPHPSYTSSSTAPKAASIADKAKKVAPLAAAGAVGGIAGSVANKAVDSTKSTSPSTSGSTSSSTPKQSFSQAFAAARKAAGGKSGKFTYNGKEYNTAVRGEKKVSTSKLRNVNPKGPTNEETEVNSHIASFLELMDSKSGNIFEAAKKLSAKQKKIAATAGDPDKIDADDFKELRGKKMEEESKDFLGGSTITKDPKKYVDPSTPKVPYSQLPKPGNKAGEVISKAKGAAGMKEEVEVSFTESELAHFEAVAKKSPHLRLGKGNEDERGMGDTVSDADTTN